MAQAVNWNPERYGSVKHVLKFDSATGTYSMDEQAHNYTGVNYNFTALPAVGSGASGTTTSGTTTQTTQDQTSAAFGDVKPHYWQDKDGKDDANVFTIPKERSSERTFIDDLSDKFKRTVTPKSYYEYKGPGDDDLGVETIYPDEKKQTTGLLQKPKQAWEWFKPLAIKAIEYATKRPTILGKSADQSFRGVAGLYNSEINLMTKYGSTGPTDMNPQGDPRKDDAGFNIVSLAGNYNKIGTNSRRHNMLATADILHEKGSKEWRNERDKIRNDWKEEKVTGIINNDYGIDGSGSVPSAPKNVVKAGNGQNGQRGNGGSKTPAEVGMTGTYDAGWT